MNNYKHTNLTTNQALNKLKQNGKNQLIKAKKKNVFALFLSQLANQMIVVLIVSAIFSYIISLYSKEGISDVIIILTVVFLNSLLGVIQEAKAEKAINALNDLTPKKSKVIRDNEIKFILSEDLVTDDIVIIESGDIIPADGILLENHSLKIDESTLTGESIAKEKDLTNDNNQVYMGSVVTYGKGIFKVTSTGMKTEMGKIAKVISDSKNNLTPLQKRLNKLSKLLTIIVISICICMFAISLLKSPKITINFVIDSFMLAISLAVAAIPEGLAAVVTILLSIGVTKMAKQKAIIRKLTAVETLGCVQIICTDKTGTLTENKMKVTNWDSENPYMLAKASFLCNDTKLQNNKWIGEPTEIALAKFAIENFKSIDTNTLKEQRVDEIPFDSTRKMMSTIHKNGSFYIQYTKGAVDVILNKCTMYLSNKGPIPLTDKIRNKILETNHTYAKNGLRVLACSYKDYWYNPKGSDKNENNLTYIGMLGMLDPIRHEVFDAIKECKDAGINVMMITGDHFDTATTIGKSINLVNNESEVITGSKLDELSDEELEKCILNYHVFARVSPLHKARIVETLQKKSLVVAMTGDGVNDAPSIKKADIGISMGIMGTDVTKSASDMVLADDNFNTIVKAVEEGRKIYANIDKAIHFLLSSNLSEVLSILIATLCGFVILDPVHILWINLITDSFPALALGLEPAEDNIMKKPPRPFSSKLFNRKTWFDILYQGIIVTILTIGSFLIGTYLENGSFTNLLSYDGKTMAFLTMSMAEIFHSFNLRSKNDSIFKIKTTNKYLWFGCLGSLILTTMVIYIPYLANLFGFRYLAYYEFAIALGLGLLIIPIVEIVKKLENKLKKSAN